jgi:hypothetical protein
MNDVMTELRAANPVTSCEPTAFQDVLRRLDAQTAAPLERASRPYGRMGRRRWLVAAVAAGVVLVVVAGITATDNPTPSVAARAFAATDTNGAVVTFTEHTELTFGPGGSGSRSSSGEVWLSGSRSRSIWTSTGNPEAAGGNETDEQVIEGSTFRNYQAQPNTILEGTLSATTNAADKIVTGQRDPVTVLRELYEQHRLANAGEVTEGGRRLDALVTTSGTAIRILVDPESFVPVQVTEHSSVTPIGETTSTTTISGYQVLPVNTTTSQLLEFAPHPGATVQQLDPPSGHGSP